SAVMGGIGAAAGAVWNLVSALSGGAQGPWWRWIIIEEGMLLLLVLAGAAVSATGLKVGGRLGGGFRWLPAAVVALPFGAIWSGYALLQGQAMNLSAHPQEAQGVLQLTWGLPLTLAIPLYGIGGVVLQLATATALASVAVLIAGEAITVFTESRRPEQMRK
ncbi:MAG: hypothetical protein NTZ05_02535, partial [Chloroflexi bacterium]|nr:hypothetical protein [Chloroflexota bacterium]